MSCNDNFVVDNNDDDDFVVDKIDDEFDTIIKKDTNIVKQVNPDVKLKDDDDNNGLNMEQLKKMMGNMSRKEMMDMKKNLMNGNMNENELKNMLNANKIDKTLDKKEKLKQKLKMLKDARKSKN